MMCVFFCVLKFYPSPVPHFSDIYARLETGHLGKLERIQGRLGDAGGRKEVAEEKSNQRLKTVGCWVVGWSGLWVLTRISAELCR